VFYLQVFMAHRFVRKAHLYVPARLRLRLIRQLPPELLSRLLPQLQRKLLVLALTSYRPAPYREPLNTAPLAGFRQIAYNVNEHLFTLEGDAHAI